MRKNLTLLANVFVTAILDIRSQFAAAVSCVATATTETILGSVIPLDVSGMNLGQAMTPLYLVISVDTTVLAAGGAANVTFKLKSADVATLDGGTAVTHFSTGAIAKADLTAGTVVKCIALPFEDYKSFLGVTFTADTNNTTAGKINAYLTMDPPAGWKAYPNAI